MGFRLNQPSLESRSNNTGLIENTFYPQDLSMLSLALLLNSDPMTVGDVFAIDVEYNAHWFDNKFINLNKSFFVIIFNVINENSF